jgi:uncharacterized cupin superfamily protein
MSLPDMTPPIFNIHDAEFLPHPRPAPGALGEKFESRHCRVSGRIGAKQLGYNLTAVPPGKRAFPFHGHRVNEEMFFILEGTGELRLGDAVHPLRAGDIVACPAGGPETAHQIINTGATELRYLAVSTERYPEICDYPDSAKLGFYDDMATGAPFRHLARTEHGLDYWDGEA